MFESRARKLKSTASETTPEAQGVLYEAERDELASFHKSVPAANEEPFVDRRPSGLAFGLDADLPEVTELPMEEFHGDFALGTPSQARTVEFSGLSAADKDAVFAAAKERIEKSVVQEDGTKEQAQQKVAEGILKAKQMLDDAERVIDELHQRYTMKVTERLGMESAPEFEKEIADLKAEIVRREQRFATMQAAYSKATKPLH